MFCVKKSFAWSPTVFLEIASLTQAHDIFLGLNFMGLMQSLSTYSLETYSGDSIFLKHAKVWGYSYHAMPRKCTGKEEGGRGRGAGLITVYWGIFNTKADMICYQHFWSRLILKWQILHVQVKPLSEATRTAKREDHVRRSRWRESQQHNCASDHSLNFP